jgi:hypothetical protein
MRITQADFRTVRIVAGGLTVLLRYSLYQDGDERLPESIACRGDQVTAYFLASTIRDFIAPERHGLSIQRSWTVLQEGRVGLSFCLEFPELTGAAWLLPGVARGESVPLEAEPADGSLTALPAGVYLLAGKGSVLVFADPPAAGGQGSSVELARLVQEEEPLVRVELRRPPRSGAAPGRRSAPRIQAALQVSGSLEQAARLNLVIAPARELFAQGLSAALDRLATWQARPHDTPGDLAPAALRARTREEIAACREHLLVDEGGTCGLRLSPSQETLSTSAGAGLAALLPGLFPGEEAMEELALRLADFALRAQLPTGLFCERYDLKRRSWLETDGRKTRPPVVLAGESADTAWALVVLVGLLRRRRLPHLRYLHAAARAVGALAAASAASPASEAEALVLPEPLAELYLLTGKDAHKKTLAGIRERFFAVDREPAAEDALQPALLRARAAAALSAAGFLLKGLEACLHSLLPWIHLNPGESPGQGPEPCGGLHEALGARRLLFRGFELAHLLARLGARLPQGAPFLRELLPRLSDFTLRQPGGTSFLSLGDPAGQAVGPVDSRLLIRELTARHRLLEEFPQYFPRSPARSAGSSGQETLQRHGV